MTKILIIEKNGTIRENNMPDFNELYKKCKFKKKEGFINIHSWTKEKTSMVFNLYGRTSGKKDGQSEYVFTDLEEDKKVYGTCAIVGQENQEFINICLGDWENLFKNDENLQEVIKAEGSKVKEVKKKRKGKTTKDPIKTTDKTAKKTEKNKVDNIISENAENKVDDEDDDIDALKDDDDDNDDNDDGEENDEE